MKLNADLGEHEPPERTAALMRLIDLANVACGGHAGTEESMSRVVRLARENGVLVGAHPGLAADFGRGAADVTLPALRALAVAQIEALAAVAGRQGAALHHVKLHGALYHLVETSDDLARGYVEFVRAEFPGLKIVALAGGRVVSVCRELGVEALPEAFAERGYRDDGMLVLRGQPGDLIVEPGIVAARVRRLADERRVETVSGGAARVDARTVCVHSDTPNAVEIARAAREALGPRG